MRLSDEAKTTLVKLPTYTPVLFNARQESDQKTLDCLTKQDRLPFIFLSPDFKRNVGKAIS